MQTELCRDTPARLLTGVSTVVHTLPGLLYQSGDYTGQALSQENLWFLKSHRSLDLILVPKSTRIGGTQVTLLQQLTERVCCVGNL